MPISFITGLPGSGKTYLSAMKALSVLQRNKKWHEKSGVKRLVYSNIKFSEEIEFEYSGFIGYWSEPVELINIKEADIVWDEASTHLDATEWMNMPLELKRWLQQHRKDGIEIYATTQDFFQVDKSMRRLTDECIVVNKLLGSRSPSNTRPPVKFIWGLIMRRWMTKKSMKKDDGEPEYEYMAYGFNLLSRYYCEIYDTKQKISAVRYPPLRHIERHCIDKNCTFHRTDHR